MKQSVKSLLSGSKYTGDRSSDGKRHGNGTKVWGNGDRYTGEWRNDKREGRGTFIRCDGTKYEGNWMQNLRHGDGKVWFLDGSVYDGQWRNDVASGKGVYTKDNGNKYEGEYVNDKCNGWGKYTFTNGDVYEGEWVDSKKTGRGTIRWANGRVFNGRFRNDCPVSGELQEEDGSRFDVQYDGTMTFGKGAQPISRNRIPVGNSRPVLSKPDSGPTSAKASTEGNLRPAEQDPRSATAQNVVPPPKTLPEAERPVETHAADLSQQMKELLSFNDSSPLTNPAPSNGNKADQKAWDRLYMIADSRISKDPKVELDREIEDRKQRMQSRKPTPWSRPDFTCPILGDTFHDPVICNDDGVTYDRRAIQDWMAKKSMSPCTGQPLTTKGLRPNQALSSAIAQWHRSRDYNVDSSLVSVENEIIGRGSWGQVRRGKLRTPDGRELIPIAVKIWPEASPDLEESLFNHERSLYITGAGARGLCKMYGSSVVRGKKCLLLKLYPKNLTDILIAMPGKKVPLQAAIQIAIQLFECMADLQQRRILYQDLKPSNILCDEDLNISLCDMGVCRLLPQGASKHMPSEILGTPNYMSPEMFEPKEHGGIGFECDIWGAACCLLEMLSGQIPFEGYQHGAVMQAVCKQQRIPEIPGGIPEPVNNLLRKCFSFRPSERPPILSVLADLRRILDPGSNPQSLLPQPQNPAPSAATHSAPAPSAPAPKPPSQESVNLIDI